jgi:hypothetical protein
MYDELFGVLMRFHREIVVPDIERIVGEAVGRVDLKVDALRDEMLTNFDAVYVRFDRLESEYEELNAAMSSRGSRA